MPGERETFVRDRGFWEAKTASVTAIVLTQQVLAPASLVSVEGRRFLPALVK